MPRRIQPSPWRPRRQTYDRDRGGEGGAVLVGAHFRSSGQLDVAERYPRRALEQSRARATSRDHGLTFMIANNLGELLLQEGEVEEARELLDEAQAGFEQLLGEEHWNPLASYGNRGLVFMQLGKYDEAEASFRRADEGYRAGVGNGHRGTLMARGNLGAAHFRQGELEEAEVHLRAAPDEVARWQDILEGL